MDFQHRIVPFYMAYESPWFISEEDNILADLDYLRQMYPAQAKKYLGRISEIVNTMDYEGSMIYDEYPDRWQLYRLAESILKIIKREEMEQGEQESSPEKWEWIADMIQILLFSEIYRRRRAGKRQISNFSCGFPIKPLK